MSTQPHDRAEPAAEARRAFLKRCGRYALVTTPAVTLMLTAASKPSAAGGLYGGSKRRNGFNGFNGFKRRNGR